MSKMKTTSTPRTGYDNLLDQLEKARKQMRRSHKTQKDYPAHTRQFLKFCYNKFHTQKFVNISGKHLRAYAEYMKNKGYSPNTVKSYFSGIRYMYEAAGGKNKLPSNVELGLEKRKLNEFNYAWLPAEYKEALGVALKHKRYDVYYALRINLNFGLRVEAICSAKVLHIKEAMHGGALRVENGKGGQERFIPLTFNSQKRLIAELAQKAERENRHDTDYIISATVKDGVRRQKEKLENWMYTHRNKFTATNRAAYTKPGEKQRSKNLRWHGLRYSFAQLYYKMLVDNGYSNPRRRTSEVLGHHREDITAIYLAELPKNQKR